MAKGRSEDPRIGKRVAGPNVGQNKDEKAEGKAVFTFALCLLPFAF